MKKIIIPIASAFLLLISCGDHKEQQYNETTTDTSAPVVTDTINTYADTSNATYRDSMMRRGDSMPR